MDIVCHTTGLATGGYSFGYVAHWAAGDPKPIRQTADRVITTARTILQDSGLLTLLAPAADAVAA